MRKITQNLTSILLIYFVTFSAFNVNAQTRIIYVTTTATVTGTGTKASPASLSVALSTAVAGDVIKIATGTYNIDNALNIASSVTYEGGFIVANDWQKTSLAGATTINRTTLNPEGSAGSQRLVAFYGNAKTNFRFQDITITTANANLSGMSTYGIHLTSCSDYEFVRTQVLPGAAGSGTGDDDPLTYNSTWDGSNGSNGSNGITGGGPECGCDFGGDNNGGTGGNGGAAGAGGTNASIIGGSGGAGASGGRGGDGRSDNTGLAGFNGTVGSTATLGGSGGTGGIGGPSDSNGSSTSSIFPGGNGVSGTSGSNGLDGVGSYVGGFWVPGSGTNGTSGTGGGGGGGGGGAGIDTDGCDAAGGGGSGGGGGGGGGGAGRGAFGGGSSFGIFLFDNGSGGKLTQDLIIAGTAGAAGLGGKGGIGGSRGTSVIGNGCINGDDDGNRGGRGGNGGNEQNGGNGGDGSAGLSINVHLQSGTALVTDENNFNLAAQPTITWSSEPCTGTATTFTAVASGSWNFGVNATPTANTGASVNTVFSTLGRQNITYNSNLYTGFVNLTASATTSTNSVTACGSYDWNGTTYTTSGTYTKTFTGGNSVGCDSVATLVLTITPSITPSVTIAANPGNSITTGTSVTFTATPTNGGTTPAYQWKKNNNNVGSNSVTYTDASLENGDIITCVLTSNDPCASPTTATSAGITMIVTSTNANLSALTTTAGAITPTFNAGTLAYTASVANATTSITVTPTSAEPNATITVNGTAVTSGSASGAIALAVGANTITTVVTAQDGTTTKTYTLTVTRVNNAPTVANPIANQNATEDQLFNFQFADNTFNDVDAGTTLTYTAQLNGGGTLPTWLSFDGATRTFSGTPLNTNIGTIIIDVIANDGSGGTITAIFNIVVGATLPVTLNQYSAKLQTDGTVLLTWDTFAEQSNDYFEISKSTDGQNFVLLSTIKGNGTTTQHSLYNYTDRTPKSGDNYYKLVQVDLDGAREELGIRSAKVALANDSKVTIYPNPSTDLVNIVFEAGKFTGIELIDLNGRLIQKKEVTSQASETTLEVRDLSSSSYLIKLVGKQETVTKVLVVQR